MLKSVCLWNFQLYETLLKIEDKSARESSIPFSEDKQNSHNPSCKKNTDFNVFYNFLFRWEHIYLSYVWHNHCLALKVLDQPYWLKPWRPKFTCVTHNQIGHLEVFAFSRYQCSLLGRQFCSVWQQVSQHTLTLCSLDLLSPLMSAGSFSNLQNTFLGLIFNQKTFEKMVHALSSNIFKHRQVLIAYVCVLQ